MEPITHTGVVCSYTSHYSATLTQFFSSFFLHSQLSLLLSYFYISITFWISQNPLVIYSNANNVNLGDVIYTIQLNQSQARLQELHLLSLGCI